MAPDYITRARRWCRDPSFDVAAVAPEVFEPGRNGLAIVAPIVSSPWREAFDPSLTQPLPFRSGAEHGDVPMMHGAPLASRGESESLHVLALPLGPSGGLGLLLLLPKSGDVDLDRVVRELDLDAARAWIARLEPPEPQPLALPRFRVRASMALWSFWVDFLELGRPPRPTAGQLDEIRPAVVLEVRIDERGANALTDAPHAASSGSGPRLLFDRPFAYALVDWEQGWLIAVGRVDDPGL